MPKLKQFRYHSHGPFRTGTNVCTPRVIVISGADVEVTLNYDTGIR